MGLLASIPQWTFGQPLLLQGLKKAAVYLSPVPPEVPMAGDPCAVVRSLTQAAETERTEGDHRVKATVLLSSLLS